MRAEGTAPASPNGGPGAVVEHLDVLVVGAGLSGIGAACHLRAKCPGKSFAILESREAIGGTWDLFRYPGIRSDSDMFTLSYPFRPWREPEAIADGSAILDYIRDTAREHGVDRDVRFNHRVVAAEWSTAKTRWSVVVERTDTGETLRLSCGFLFTCTGYYRYDEGFEPDLEGRDRFGGKIVHPQHWPAGLDHAGKRVVVVGSGSTAVTMIPALAREAEHVTMLQRSPGYVVAVPGRDPVAALLRRLLSAKRAYSVVRWKNVLLMTLSYRLSRRFPRAARAAIRLAAKRQLPDGYEVDVHFKPRYDPWDQRVCAVPGGDLFRAIRHGDASIVTDRIDAFTERGLRLTSGAELEADVVVMATGLNLLALGGMELTVDGRAVDLSEVVGYKGLMFSGVPNLAVALGYTNASWTLKSDLVCDYVCRLLNHMDARGLRQATPRWREAELPEHSFIDLAAGYVMRSIDEFPKQGERAPWRLHQNYFRDVLLLRHGDLEDDALEFSPGGVPVDEPDPVAA